MAEKKSSQQKRPPVVAVMGHVDHGKSTLLDYIRKTNTVDAEAGGITQHVSAYEIEHETKEGARKITFIDTPGHEAFLTMRRRGASIADIIILVVSADDGVKAQTIESLKIIEGAQIPYIVAINKIDKPNADVNRAKQSLAEQHVLLEGYGGNIPNAAISAKTGEGVDELLDLILLASDLEEFVGTEDENASGFILESHVDPKVGTCVQFVIKDGTLAVGDFFVADGVVSKIRSLQTLTGESVARATFSTPLQTSGLAALPESGSVFLGSKTKEEAEELANKQQKENDSLKTDTVEEEKAYIPIIIKADVLGTLQAIEGEIKKLESEKADIKIIHKGIGNITESDAKIASGSKGPIVIGFHVKVDPTAQDTLDRYGITYKVFDVIYKISEFLEPEVRKREPKELIPEVRAEAKVIRLFSKTNKRQVVGADIVQGEVTEGAHVKLVRNDNEIGDGTIKELQVEKKKVKKAEEKTKAGLTIECKTTIALGDRLQIIVMVEK